MIYIQHSVDCAGPPTNPLFPEECGALPSVNLVRTLTALKWKKMCVTLCYRNLSFSLFLGGYDCTRISKELKPDITAKTTRKE